MLKGLSELSLAGGWPESASVTRTFALLLGVSGAVKVKQPVLPPGTVHPALEPLFAAEAIVVVWLSSANPLVEYSIFTVETVPATDQLMVAG